jgi:hypothetical protein
MLGAALLVAVLACAADLLLLAATRVIVSPGLTGRRSLWSRSAIALAEVKEVAPLTQTQGET